MVLMLYPWDKSVSIGIPQSMIARKRDIFEDSILNLVLNLVSQNLNPIGLYDYTLRKDVADWCKHNRARFIVAPTDGSPYPYNVRLHSAEKATLFKLWWS